MNVVEYFTITYYQIVHNSFILQQGRVIMIPWANAKLTRKPLPQLYRIFSTSASKWQLESENIKTGKCCSFSLFYLHESHLVWNLKVINAWETPALGFLVQRELGGAGILWSFWIHLWVSERKLNGFELLFHTPRNVYYKSAHLTINKQRFWQ